MPKDSTKAKAQKASEPYPQTARSKKPEATKKASIKHLGGGAGTPPVTPVAWPKTRRGINTGEETNSNPSSLVSKTKSTRLQNPISVSDLKDALSRKPARIVDMPQNQRNTDVDKLSQLDISPNEDEGYFSDSDSPALYGAPRSNSFSSIHSTGKGNGSPSIVEHSFKKEDTNFPGHSDEDASSQDRYPRPISITGPCNRTSCRKHGRAEGKSQRELEDSTSAESDERSVRSKKPEVAVDEGLPSKSKARKPRGS